MRQHGFIGKIHCPCGKVCGENNRSENRYYKKNRQAGVKLTRESGREISVIFWMLQLEPPELIDFRVPYFQHYQTFVLATAVN